MPATTHTMVAFIKRKEGMSLEEFYKYWEEVHGPLVKPWAEKHGLTYKQIHTGSNAPTGVDSEFLSKYDGCAIFEFSDPNAISVAFADPEFKRDVSPDQEFFMQEQVTIMATGSTVTIV
ncbi:hypothetical protein SEUCBS139899_000981 [Sporothrix eucalyptigena]